MATTTFTTTTATAKDSLHTAEWIIKIGESRLGREFILWNAASEEEAFCHNQMLPAGSEGSWDYWENEIENIPRPP